MSIRCLFVDFHRGGQRDEFYVKFPRVVDGDERGSAIGVLFADAGIGEIVDRHAVRQANAPIGHGDVV